MNTAAVARTHPGPARAGWRPERIYVERSEADTLVARRVRERAGDVPLEWVEDARAVESPADFLAGKRRLVLQRHRGSFLNHCPAGTTGLVCCNYLVMNFASNCPYDCSYCFLQSYLAENTPTRAFTNVADGLAEIGAVLRAHPERTFRVGTGELADSLALDELTGLSAQLVPFFAAQPNGILELKTKSTCVDDLLDLEHRERTVVSWSVNAPAIVAAEEPGTATLDERFAAAARVQASGYRVGFHFDPLIAHDGWEEGYRDVVGRMFRGLDTRRVAWVSLGSLRMTAALESALRARRRHGHVLGSELVPGPDGKRRVWQGMRVKMYRRMLAWLREVDERMPLYICMEPAGVWEKVFGEAPTDREVGQRLVEGLA